MAAASEGHEFDPSERQAIRNMLKDWRGSGGRVGLNDRLRRLEWILLILFGFVVVQWLEGRIRIVPGTPTQVDSTHAPQSVTISDIKSQGGEP